MVISHFFFSKSKLQDNFKEPNFYVPRREFYSQKTLHYGFMALDIFKKKHGTLPESYEESHANEISHIAWELNNNQDLQYKDILRQMSFVARGQISGVVRIF